MGLKNGVFSNMGQTTYSGPASSELTKKGFTKECFGILDASLQILIGASGHAVGAMEILLTLQERTEVL